MTWLSDRVVGRLRDVASWPELPQGRYRIMRPIGHGGMGRVFLARDDKLNRDVAVKVSNAAAAGTDLDARLQREALVLADLEHPGIVPVHDVGVLDDGRLFYVMKLVQGQTLAEHAASLDGEHARLSLFERILDAIAFAHARGVVHRDLKPSNVMVGAFGEVLVVDWGTARIRDALSSDSLTPAPTLSARASATVAGTRMGTPGFMAPEQAEGRVNDVAAATDVYALGALLQWLLGDAAPEAPKRLRAIIDRCKSTAPGDRYPDARALAADLARYRDGLAVDAYKETVWDRAARWFAKYRTFILLIVAYLIMRALVAWLR